MKNAKSNGLTVQANPGKAIRFFLQKLKKDLYQLTEFDIIIVHIGTVDFLEILQTIEQGKNAITTFHNIFDQFSGGFGW